MTGVARALVAFGVCLALPASAATWPELSSPPPPQGGGEKDAALVVGIERYSEVPSIPGATKNADDWFAFLTRTLKVPAAHVTLLRDKEGTVEKIRKYAAEAASQVQPGGTVWLVFIGHGAPAKDGTDGVLVGYDAQQDADSLYARSIAQKELLSVLGSGKQARTVVVLDACFSGRTASGELVKGLQPVIALRAAAAGGTKTLVLTAGQADQFAGPLPDANRPAFSYLVLGALRGWGDRDANGVVTGGEALNYAREVLQTVVKDRTQIPELSGPANEALGRGTEVGPDLTSMVLARQVPAGGSELQFGGALDIRVPRITVTSVSGLKDINMQAETELEHALDVEDNKALAPEDKSAAWCRLAAVPGNNPYVGKAREGCRSWRVYAKALRKQETALAEDYHTLAGYLRLKRKSHEQKLAAANAFLAAYRAFSDNAKVKRVSEAKQALTGGSEPALADEVAQLEDACGKGQGQSCQILGGMHARGIWPFTREEAKAVDLYAKSCDSGYAAGCSELAAMYADGRGVAADPRRAAEFYGKACDANDGSGCNGLGDMHQRGRLGKVDLARAAEFFQRSCDDGDAIGCLRIGDLTFTGQGVGTDARRAAELYERGCEGGAAEACSKLADQYGAGTGVPRDLDKALALHGRNCDGGNAASCVRMGDLVAGGDGAKALASYRRGCDLGDQSGCEKVAARKAELDRAEAARLEAAAREQERRKADERDRTAHARAMRFAGYACVVGGVAIAAGGGGLLQYGALSSVDDVKTGHVASQTEAEETLSSAQSMQTGAIAVAVLGAVVAGVGVPIILMNPDPEAPKVSFVPTPHGGFVVAGGSF